MEEKSNECEHKEVELLTNLSGDSNGQPIWSKKKWLCKCKKCKEVLVNYY